MREGTEVKEDHAVEWFENLKMHLKGEVEQAQRSCLKAAHVPPWVWQTFNLIVQLLVALRDRGEGMVTAVWQTVNKLTPQPAVECVLFREAPDGVQVFLIQRPADDPYYANQWHCAGTFLRSREHLTDILKRIAARGELGVTPTQWGFGGVLNSTDEAQCHMVHLVLWMETHEQPAETERARWFLVDELPPNVMPFHPKIIAMAVEGWCGMHGSAINLENLLQEYESGVRPHDLAELKRFEQ